MGRRLAVDERRNRQRCRFQAKLTPLLYGVATDGDQCPRCFCLRLSFRCSKRASASSVRHESIRTLAKPPTRFVTHGKATRDYSLSLAMTKTCNLGFTNDAQVTPVDSLAIAAGGLQAKGRLSFKTGVFGANEPPKATRRALWDKNKNSKP